MDIVAGIDTVVAAWADLEVDSIAAEPELGLHLVADQPDTAQDFDPTTDTVIVLEMC